MPRRNLCLLILVSVFSLICYQKVQTNRYGRVLADAMQQIEQRALKEITPEALFEGAIEGMIVRLDDPYSSFVPPKQLEAFNETIDAQFGGVGMLVSKPETDQLTVMNPVVGIPAPAYEAGIRAGDTIHRIDDRSTQGLSLQDAVTTMRGKPDSPVTLAVVHQGAREPVEIEILRQVIRIDTVLGDTRKPDDLSWNFFLEGYNRIGYVRIESFSTETAEEAARALEWLGGHDVDGSILEEPRNALGLILDLRDDPGGLLTAAEEICDMFIDAGVIVSRHRRDEVIVSKATRPGTYLGFPMVVLVNHLSASASEIVAACLQDHGRAIVVGQRTWGKGTVQEVITLPEQRGALRLTTSSYHRPSNKNIHREKGAGKDEVWGVSPNKGCEVILDETEHATWRRWRLRRDISKLPGGRPQAERDPAELSIDNDPQLAKAVEYVEAELARSRRGAADGD